MAQTTLAAANMQVSHDKQANIGRILQIIEEAADRGVDLLVLPELALQGYIDFALRPGSPQYAAQRRYFISSAEPVPGPATEVIAAAARRHRMHVQVGMAEAAAHGGVVFNSAVLIGPDGVTGSYRKLHNQAEYPFFVPGDGVPVFDLPQVRAASMICYDLVFPEVTRVCALQGAEITLMSTAWPMQGNDPANDYFADAMDLLSRAAAFVNQMWLVISNHCGAGAYSSKVEYYGGSQIISPTGRVVARLDQQEGLACYTADLRAEVMAARTEAFFGLSLLADRRPAQYELLTRDYTTPPGRPAAARPAPARPATASGGDQR
jgi:predicted amidohydrolase